MAHQLAKRAGAWLAGKKAVPIPAGRVSRLRSAAEDVFPVPQTEGAYLGQSRKPDDPMELRDPEARGVARGEPATLACGRLKTCRPPPIAAQIT